MEKRSRLRAVAVKLQGGMGNQMFQYAVARSISLKHCAPLVLDVTALQSGLRRYQLENFRIEAGVVSDRAHLKAFRDVGERWFHFDPQVHLAGPGDRLVGYFQSELYFSEIANQIRDDFRLASAWSSKSCEVLKAIRGAEAPVAVHVRNYALEGVRTARFHGRCEPDYYRRAMRLLSALTEGRARFFVFSESVEAIRQVIPASEDIVPVIGGGERAWEDLKLMSACRHNVVANSSFSWWGAWLGAAPAQTVVAPRAWFGRATLEPLNTLDLTPQSWILA